MVGINNCGRIIQGAEGTMARPGMRRGTTAGYPPLQSRNPPPPLDFELPATEG